jgi:hypothetical protein
MALPFCEPAKTTGGKGGKGGNLTMRPCRPEDLFVPQHMTREVNEMRAAGTLSKARSGQQKRLPHYRKYRKFLRSAAKSEGICRGTSTCGVNCGELEYYDAGLS